MGIKPTAKIKFTSDHGIEDTEKKSLVKTKIVLDDPMFKPERKTSGSSGYDLVANLKDKPGQQITFPYRHTEIIDCGFKMKIPEGYEALITPRSSMGAKGLIVTNSPGTIDSDFCGKIKVLITNVGKEVACIKHGDRIAQMKIVPVYGFDFEEVEGLEETNRGEGGFGSTGR